MAAPERVLLVDGDPDIHELAAVALEGLAELQSVRSRAEADIALATEPALLVLDLDLPDGRGEDLVAQVKESAPLVPVLVLSALQDVTRATSVLNNGAEDYLLKPIHPVHLRRKVERIVSRRRTATAVAQLRARQGPPRRSEALGLLRMGRSEKMEELAARVELVSVTDVPVLIVGETGTGKEVVARAIHECSGRAARPFVTVNCGAVPTEMFEAELFGHTAGAFTGATSKRKGLAREADGGTLFLDEIGETPMDVQAKLLRFLQDGEVRPVGSDKAERVDTRVVFATNRDLELEVAEKRFREDLAYRIRVVELDVPPLRDRGADVGVLAEYFLREANGRLGRSLAGFERAALRGLHGHTWPGNVRELQSTVQRAAVFAPGDRISAVDLGLRDAPSAGGTQFDPELLDRGFMEAKGLLVDAFERAYVAHALEVAGGSVAEAARRAGIARKSMWRIAKRVGLAAPAEERRAESPIAAPVDRPRRTFRTGMTPEAAGYLGAAARNYRIRTLANVAEQLRALDTGAPGPELERFARRVRGSGGSFGLPGVSARAEALLAAIGTGDPGACREALLAVQAELTRGDIP